MTLGFSTKFKDGTPTLFINKIWCGLIDFDSDMAKKFDCYYRQCPEMQSAGYTATLVLPPKLHTIREDKCNRWKPETDIHFVINNRTKYRLQFAPVVKCVSVQQITIWYNKKKLPRVIIDGKMFFPNSDTVLNLARNDGFYSVDDFFKYFKTDFKGKIIHWTNLKY